jgi:putative FmdB family regulatory protein
MPLYEYRCRACDHVFDVIQKFSDPPLTECPECGGAVDKCVSSPAIQFKGSGFYITDYTDKGKKSAEKKGGKAAGKGTEAADKPAKAAKPKDPA